MAWMRGIWWTQRSPVRSTSGASVKTLWNPVPFFPSITHNPEHCCGEAPGTAKIMCLQVSSWVFGVAEQFQGEARSCGNAGCSYMHWRRLWQWKYLLWAPPPNVGGCDVLDECGHSHYVFFLWIEVSVRANKALLLILLTSMDSSPWSLMLHRQWQTGWSGMLEPRDIAFCDRFLLTQKQSLPVYFSLMEGLPGKNRFLKLWLWKKIRKISM